MKRIVSLVSIGVIIMIALFAAQPAKAQVRFGASISFQNFYDELSPYGDWIDYPDYGYTWRPRLGRDFRPYATNGYWSYADGYDWTWVSDYDWGWAPFHYGRWFYDPYYGWLWVPGYEWSPAWVAWRGGGDYYGWAPLRPGFNISFGFDNYNAPYDYWTFAPCNYMTSRHISRYYYPYRNNINIFNRTIIINNYDRHRGGRDGFYRNGPSRHEVERYTGRINAIRVRDMDRPGRNSVRRDELSVYRPSVNRVGSNDRFVPRNVRTYDREAVSNRGEMNNGRGSGRDNGNYGRNNNRNNMPDRNRANDNRNAERGQRQDQVIQQRDVNNERSVEARQRATEMRQRNDQVQREQMRQRDVENQRAVERQRNEQYQREQQRQDQVRTQRDQESQRRMMDNRRQQMEQERVQRDNQRSMEMRQRNEEMQRVQQQRESQRQQAQAQQQREIRTRETQVERPSRDFGGRGNSGGDRGSRESGRGRF